MVHEQNETINENNISNTNFEKFLAITLFMIAFVR